MTKEITGWDESFNKEFEVSKGPGRFHEKETFPCEGGYCSTDVSEIKGFISKAIASAVEARESKYREALIWCSGSDDFQLEGKAREGWEKICLPLINPSKE